MFVWVEDTLFSSENYNMLSTPIKFYPVNIPFNEPVKLYYENFSDTTIPYGIYSFNGKKWIFKELINNENKVEVKIYSGGVYAILNENKPPVIRNIHPAKNSKYRKEDLDFISFNCFDEESNINYENIEIFIDNIKFNYDYIKYRKLIRAKVFDRIRPGKHILKIIAEDNLKNKKAITHTFYVQ